MAQQASHPYLQQLYAAAAQQQAYAQAGLTPNIMQVAHRHSIAFNCIHFLNFVFKHFPLQLAGLQGGTGNPLLDMYSQYAAAYQPQVDVQVRDTAASFSFSIFISVSVSFSIFFSSPRPPSPLLTSSSSKWPSKWR